MNPQFDKVLILLEEKNESQKNTVFELTSTLIFYDYLNAEEKQKIELAIESYPFTKKQKKRLKNPIIKFDYYEYDSPDEF